MVPRLTLLGRFNLFPDMSKNISALSFRKGIEKNYFERMVEAAEETGTAANEETVRELAGEYLVGDAITLGAVSFYDFLKKENEGKKVLICNGSACLCAGTQEGLRSDLGKSFSEDEVGHICCLGRCHEGGAFQYEGKNYSGQSSDALVNLFEGREGADSSDNYAIGCTLDEPMLTAEFTGIDEFYAPFKKLLADNDRDALFTELDKSKLRGRGGAGFPLSFKWQSCRHVEGEVKYIVCNADEGDPGAYIDKYLMEKQPHSVLFGMMVSAWFVGAQVGILYIRKEYPDSIDIINEAIADLHEAGLLGDDICGSGFSFKLKTIKGAGAYICGEETALLASLEGARPEVRIRPPFPTVEGLFRKPTIVNNVETFANIPFIIGRGGDAFAKVGTEQSTGPKLVSLDANFKTPGLYECAMGTPMTKIVEELGGGFKVPVKAIQVGGPLGGIVPTEKISELTLDFESFKDGGFLLGHAGIVSIPESFPMIQYIEHMFEFTADESCGKCFPCRLGSVRGKELVQKAQADSDYKIDPKLIHDLLDTMQETSLCALGGGVPLPIQNALEYFEDELRGYFAES